MSEGATRPMDKLYARMKKYIVHADSPSRDPKLSRELTSEQRVEPQAPGNVGRSDIFTSSAPPHAFPSPYPATCSYEPFPCKDGVTSFGDPEWRRVPVSRNTCLPSASISIDELVERLSQLNVRGESRTKESHRPQCAATFAITVIPSRAPHPYLIPCRTHYFPNSPATFPSVRASATRLRAFKSPSPPSEPITLVPFVGPLMSTTPQRKTAPLPRRFPSRPQETLRDASPTMSESSTTSPSPRVFSPDCETRSCSFSSVSSFLPSPPKMCIQELPLSFGSPCRSLFEVPTYPFSDVFRDMPPNPLSPVS
ncbi:hypothetical protein PAXRUDRAFT_835225 [Paxillus rubicundulus Ve08.2h10]|uniref:Uncharacterized protein n=1 Tax=Paxillus rubicundulus Ve08.2h10 TaxID=930991 RepID=A0A0D0CNG2_9AGAM|nr:hypothetical protein PAXRUDRAFT_835225 [Paxillus rubicundulus Ve08.2h10]